MNMNKTEKFIEKANRIWSNKFDYTKTVYIDAHTHVIITCPIHGDFPQSPTNHLSHKGCTKCTNTYKPTNIEVIQRFNDIHNFKYEYPDLNYKNNKELINIFCSVSNHGMFQKNYISHYINKSGCDKCIAEKYSFENFTSEANLIHNNLYDYYNAKKVWKNYTTTIPITCRIHGDFNMLPHNHLKNQGCSKCSLSKGEKRIAIYLDSKNISYKQFHSFDDCRYKRKLIFDFYLEQLNMCIEYDGIQHFQNVKRFENDLEITQIRDNIKNEYCLNKGICMLRIPYTSFDDIEAILESKIFYSKIKVS